MLLAGVPAKDGALSGIRDGVGNAGAAEPLAQVHAIDGNSPFRFEPKGTVTAKPASRQTFGAPRLRFQDRHKSATAISRKKPISAAIKMKESHFARSFQAPAIARATRIGRDPLFFFDVIPWVADSDAWCLAQIFASSPWVSENLRAEPTVIPHDG